MINPIVFLVDVDNTLLDNDTFQDDLSRFMERRFGTERRDRYWAMQEERFATLGYRDYLGALQTFRDEHPFEPHMLSSSSCMLDYPFAERLYLGAMQAIDRLRGWGRTVILSDGDAVFQPRKVELSGISAAVDGHVLIYIHKEDALADIERRYPARHYVMLDDKLRILTAIKQAWGDRVTTVFVRQGKLALDPEVAVSFPAADVTLERIGDLLEHELSDLIGNHDSEHSGN